MTAQLETDVDRGLRKEYRDLSGTIRRHEEDLADYEKPTLRNTLTQADVLHQKVRKPREQAVDSEVFAHLAGSGVEMAKKLVHGGKGHTVKDFLRRLKVRYVSSDNAQDDGALDPTAFNWALLGQHISSCFKTAPGIYCMVGPMDAQPKVRKMTQRQVAKPLGELVNPDEVADLGETEKQETDKNMEEMWSVLRKYQQVNLLELIMNHNSFAQTAENCFALSFLVRDERVRLVKDLDDGCQVVALPKGHASDSTAPQERMQFVVTLTLEDWEEWKQYVDRSLCRMRHRHSHQQTNSVLANSNPRKRSLQEAGQQPAAGEPSKRQRHWG